LHSAEQVNPGNAVVNKGLINEEDSFLAVFFSRIVPNAFRYSCSCNHRLHPCYKKGGQNLSEGVAGWSRMSPVKQNARDLAAGRDTVLGAAKRYLLEKAISLGKG